MTELLIFDYSKRNLISKKIIGKQKFHWIFLGSDYRMYKEIQSFFMNSGMEIPFDENFFGVVKGLKEQYINFIASQLKTPKGNGDIYSSLIEKIPFKSNIYQNICYIHFFLKRIQKYEKDTIIVICEENCLARDLYSTLNKKGTCEIVLFAPSLISFKEFFTTFFRTSLHCLFLAWLLTFRMIYSRYLIKNSFQEFFRNDEINILHTWAGISSYKNGKYQELFYGNLQEILEIKGNCVLLLPHIPFDISYRKCILSLVQENKKFICEEFFLSVSDILHSCVLCLTNLPEWKEYHLTDLDFSACAYRQAFDDWAHLQVLMPDLYRNVISGMAKKGLKIHRFTFLYENYAYEKSLIINLRKFYPDTAILGYQHSTISANHMSFSHSSDPIEEEYIPDFIITSGNIPAKILVMNNYSDSRILIGGAVRYSALKKTSCNKSNRLHDQKNILIALPINLSESIELIERFVRSFKGSSDIQILCKPHPFLGKNILIRHLESDVQKQILFTEKSLEELLSFTTVLVYSSSSSCIDALTQCIPVMKIILPRRIDLDPLVDVQGQSPFIQSASDPHEIDTVTRKMISYGYSLSEQETLRHIVNDIIGDVTESTILAFTHTKEHTNQKINEVHC